MTKTKIMAWREKEREGRGERREQKTEGERECIKVYGLERKRGELEYEKRVENRGQKRSFNILT